jgi:hypothetical protein
MRFLPGGPALPDDLLNARDEGQVIFFCGAGVSRAKANLPDFYGLADLVVEDLHVAPDSPARRLIVAAKSQEHIAGVGGLLPQTASLPYWNGNSSLPTSEPQSPGRFVRSPALTCRRTARCWTFRVTRPERAPSVGSIGVHRSPMGQ